MRIRSILRQGPSSAGAFALVLFLILVSPAYAEAPSPGDFPRSTMRGVFDDIKVLVPLSMNEDAWRSETNRESILAALARLEKSIDTLERHGRDREAGFSRIALDLMGDFGHAYEFYRTGRFDESRFFLTGSLNSCISCHVRLPSEQSFHLADELMKASELDALDPADRAWMLVTVRRFDEALDTWESLLHDESISASQLDARGILADYLNVSIRVRGAIERASNQLKRFSKRPDLPVYLTYRVREWRDALAALAKDDFTPNREGSLERGIELAKEAGSTAEGPYGRDVLVQDLAAASHLVRWLELAYSERRHAKISRNLTAQERHRRSLAYYWLGVVEARSLDGFWINLSEQHLEASVRADPKGSIAPKAYSLLEENQILGYGGSSGVHLPADVWTLLKELRELMGLES